jgi:hypothetical protein
VRVKGEIVLGDYGKPLMETVVDKDVLKMVVQSAQLILDRTGFSPVGTREIGGMDAPRTIIEEADGTLRELSPEQLQQREEEAKKKYKLGNLAIGIGQGRKN